MFCLRASLLLTNDRLESMPFRIVLCGHRLTVGNNKDVRFKVT